jgi:hypothetical protein
MKRIIKFPKARITDYRPREGAISPVGNRIGSTTGGSVSRSEAMEHDRAILGYGEETLLAAAQDLGHRRCWNRHDHEHRWVMNRVAAILRALDRKGAFQ